MRFVYGEPAVLHKGALILGDTHFGIEQKLERKGVHYSGISDHVLQKLLSLIKRTGAKRLIILGDVKENITGVDWMTRNIFARLQKQIHVTVVRGNHDGGIEQICKDTKPADGYVYGELGLLHGNAWPAAELMRTGYIISAHQHPQIEIRDRSGKIYKEPAWFVLPPHRTKIKSYYGAFNEKTKLVLMPAFNPLVGNAMKLNVAEHLGPLLYNKLFKLNDALVYRLNGACLGKLKSIGD